MVGWDDIVEACRVSVQERSSGTADGSTRQIERIEASSREPLIACTLAAISESKIKSFASATVMQCVNGLEVKLKLIRAGTAPIHSNPIQMNNKSGLLVKSIATWSIINITPFLERGTSRLDSLGEEVVSPLLDNELALHISPLLALVMQEDGVGHGHRSLLEGVKEITMVLGQHLLCPSHYSLAQSRHTNLSLDITEALISFTSCAISNFASKYCAPTIAAAPRAAFLNRLSILCGAPQCCGGLVDE